MHRPKDCNKRLKLTYTTLLLIIFTIGFAYAQDQYTPESGNAAYYAEINEVNPDLTQEEVSGQATLIVKDGQLSVTLVAKGLAPGIMHLQHMHGFKGSDEGVTCPTAEADTNGDGIIDLIETHPHTGVTLIPFNAAPAELTILSSSYPVANENGLLTYEITVPLDELETAVREKYGIGQLALEDLAIYIHGVPEDAGLPDSVQSLPDVPATVTVPVACGALEAF